jgi:DNA repair exonuclease SbcCD nuclease subunit
VKLLYITDTHIRGTTPKNRKDNLLDTLIMKFKEINNIAKEYSVDYILHGGDLFDRPDISTSIARKFAILLDKFQIPIYLVAGNHDLYGHNPDTLHRTLLGLFDAIGLVTLIKENQKIILQKNGIKLQLTGQSYKYDIDSKLNKEGYIVEEKEKSVDYAIHIVHGMLLDRPFIKGIPYTLIDEITNTKADITLSGHYHSGFGVKKINNKYFINPGSLIRITNSLQEIERYPQAVLINLTDGIDIDMIKLKTAKPGKEVLDRQQIELSIYRNERLMQFKQSIDSSTSFEKLDITHILNTLANAEEISSEVKEEAINRISLAQMDIKGDETQ